MIWNRDKARHKIVSSKEFDDIFSKEVKIADLRNQQDEDDYAQRDNRLIQLLKSIVLSHTKNENTEEVWIGQDWWPDHTRHIEINYCLCSSHLISDLQSVLTGEFSNYRIQMCVYRDISEGESYVGSLVLYTDKRLIEKPLYDLLIAK